MLPRSSRLNRALAERVQRSRVASHSAHLTLKYAPEPELQRPRLSIVVPKRAVKLASDRNLLKRRLAALVRPKLPFLPPRLYLITVTSIPAGKQFKAFEVDLAKLFNPLLKRG